MSRSLTESKRALLSAEGLCFAPDAGPGITFVVHPGERIGILGMPGSGKTQFLRTLAHLEPVVDGQLLWGDVNVTHKARWLLGRDRIHVALILKNPYTFLEPWLSVQSLFNKRLGQKRQSENDIVYYLNNVGLSSVVRSWQIQTLSGMERVLLAVAYALSSQPKLLLVDDVFGTLLPETWKSVLSHIQKALQPQQALMIASQYGQVLKIVDTVFVLWHGRVIEWGAREAVFTAPYYAYTRDLLTYQYGTFHATYSELSGLLQDDTGFVEKSPWHWVMECVHS